MSIKDSGIVKFLSNKYALAFLLFAVWLLFFDQDNYFARNKVDQQIQELESDISFYRTEVEKLKEDNRQLNEEPEVLEKYAREHFYMAKPSEDVYIVVKE